MTMTMLPSDLEPVVEELLHRHLETAKEWFPHELVPWSQGRDFESGVDWDPNEAKLSEIARVALFVNLLTEDNLPYYTVTLLGAGSHGPWGEWTRRWTAEEGRHAIVIRDYLTVTRSIDPVALERGRMHGSPGLLRGKQPRGGSSDRPVVTQGLEESARQHRIPVLPALALLDANGHA